MTQFDPNAAPPAPVVGYYTPGTQPVQYAGFGLRLVAVFIDGLVLLIPNIIVAVVLMIPFGIMSGNPSQSSAVAFQLLFRVASVLIGWIYYAKMESSPKKATFGKQAMGIIVTDEMGNGLSFANASGRYFGKLLSGICFIGFIMAAFTQRKQALHDIMAHALVVKKPL